MGAQQLQRARDRNEDRDAFETEAVDHARGFELGIEVDLGSEQRGRPKAHELAEDVAERKAVEEAQRVEDALVAEILLHLALDRVEAGQDVAMGVDDALGRGRGAGREDDLEGRVERNGWVDGEERLGRQKVRQIVEGELWDVGRQRGNTRRVGQDELGGDVGDDAGPEVGRTCGVERNSEDAAQQAAEEGRDPLGGVFAPQDDAVAGSDAAPFELGGESPSQGSKVDVGSGMPPHAAIAHDGRLPAVAAQIVDQTSQMGTHERSSVN